MSPGLEKRALQAVVAVACLVPLYGGLAGIWEGTGGAPPPGGGLDSHVRYLSGLLLGIGIGFAGTIPHIERHAARFRLLTLIVVAGALGRLAGLVLVGPPPAGMLAALGMEFVVTPALCCWQNSLARRHGRDARPPE